ncbi:MAG: hypothetical protein G3M78_06520 [Candidatus Nitrohelix vancouverensis]|uniref:Uncharacterized protein n=1 Tax=Candidatus Nitrohelix vancouverensis TaxID=2705534 RepID=A0A7T0C1Z5_9BACT|nr:MAG: hypothetical protein G3M78_06520 [Candidatus Nitrohelix vancouverensis]
MKKMVSIFTVFAVLALVAVANANVNVIQPGGQSVCENASWKVDNLSETEETVITFNIGPYGYGWGKDEERTLAPGDFLTNAMAKASVITNKGPGPVAVNCQRQRFDRHDWKIDAGSSKTYQSDYHMDHVKPQLYIEPGMGQPEGTERGLFSQVAGSEREANR